MMYDELVKRLRELPHLLFVQLHGHEDVVYQAADAIEELQRQIDAWVEPERKALIKSLPKWIPVTERLPKGADKSGEICENVWLLFDDDNVYPGWMNGITEKVYYLDNYSDALRESPISRVEMWQPKPEPPEGEES